MFDVPNGFICSLQISSQKWMKPRPKQLVSNQFDFLLEKQLYWTFIPFFSLICLLLLFSFGKGNLEWWELWNFIVWQMRFNRFLHLNEFPRKIFSYLGRQLYWEKSKIGRFQFQKSTFKGKNQLNLLKMIFVLEYQTRR